MKFLPALVLLVPLALFVGFYWGDSTDYRTEQVNLISCSGYSEEQLRYMGNNGETRADMQKSCEDLHMALRGQALDECDERIGTISGVGESNYNRLMDSCVYHELAATIGTVNSVELIKYRSSGR